MAHVAKSVGLVALVCLSAAATAGAQRAGPEVVSGPRAFAAEALGGTIGSAIGIAIGLAVARPDDCPSEDDVACALQRLGITGIVGVAGATLGTAVAGHMVGSEPSTVGAFLGAAAGAVVGIGLEHLITEEMGVTDSLGGIGTVVLFSVTQGIFAAAGSRLGAALRR